MDSIEAHGASGGALAPEATARERSMMAYAMALTDDPGRLSRALVDAMRGAGLDDQAILEVNQVVAYFAYVNRVVDGLGVELEDYWDRDPADGSSTP
ncbi:MAG: hypothetical protein AAGF11_54350 [Myxococcota bacterium]